MTLNEYVEAITKLMIDGIERDEEEIKKKWAEIKAECERKRPDIKTVKNALRIIEERTSSIHAVTARLDMINTFSRLLKEENDG